MILTHISLYFAQSRTELRLCQVLSFLHSSEMWNFRFGPAVRSTDDTLAYKVYIVLDNILGIQKNHTCTTVTRHVTELEQFQKIKFFDEVILGFKMGYLTKNRLFEKFPQ